MAGSYIDDLPQDDEVNIAAVWSVMYSNLRRDDSWSCITLCNKKGIQESMVSTNNPNITKFMGTLHAGIINVEQFD